jgi:NitT/TauT family transport system substrate-binding protein
MKKYTYIFLFVILFFSIFAFSFANGKKKETITASGPKGLVSLPFLRMMESKTLSTHGISINFIPWKNPEQLRAIIAGKQAGLIGMPCNVAANFYNRGIDIKLYNCSLWKILWIVSNEKKAPELGHFKGRDIAVPFKGELPEIIFSETAKKLGLDPEKDFNIRYTGSALDAARLLISGRINAAVLSEPSCSLALIKSGKRHSQKLYRSLDLQKEWGRAFNKKSRIALAGVAVTGRLKGREKSVLIIMDEYSKALKWCKKNPIPAGKLAAKYFPSFNSEAISKSIIAAELEAVPAMEAKSSIEHFFMVLYKSNPKKIGGKMPGNNFYWQP